MTPQPLQVVPADRHGEDDAAEAPDGASAADTADAGTASAAPTGQAYDQFCAEVAAGCEQRLYRRARGLTASEPDARDLVQRTLEKGLASLHRFQSGTNLRAWLLRILMNLFIDDCRQASRTPRMEPIEENTAISGPPDDADEEREPRWARIGAEEVQAALRALPPLAREVYRLRLLEQLSYEQIAARLKIPTGTVGTRLARARARLQELLLASSAGAPRIEEDTP